jgi:5S rRNA maturation endonuclease (ribonuclease M5)
VTQSSDSGIIDIPSNHPVDQTVERLQEILQQKAVTLFALIDRSGEALALKAGE